LLGLPAVRLSVGDPADLVLFEWQEGQPFRVRHLILGGKQHLDN
jgi:hypothetical protein